MKQPTEPITMAIKRTVIDHGQRIEDGPRTRDSEQRRHESRNDPKREILLGGRKAHAGGDGNKRKHNPSATPFESKCKHELERLLLTGVSFV